MTDLEALAKVAFTETDIYHHRAQMDARYDLETALMDLGYRHGDALHASYDKAKYLKLISHPPVTTLETRDLVASPLPTSSRDHPL